MTSPTERVAEALSEAANEVVFGESNDEAWNRLAQAAVDALGLTEERRTVRSICDMADPGIPQRRLVGPWIEGPARDK